MEQLIKQVKLLKVFVAVLTIVVMACVGVILKVSGGHFKEITAERLNVVEHDGTLRMVISNRARQHPGAMDHKDLPKRDRPAGMIFFNDEGDECGGLVYDGDKKSASMTYSIDQYKHDQVMQLQFAQDNLAKGIEKSYGLKMWERNDNFTLMKLAAVDDSLKKLKDTVDYKAGMARLKAAGLLSRERLFVGRTAEGEVGVFLADNKGNPRLKIYINKQNQPVIETLNEKGEVLPVHL